MRGELNLSWLQLSDIVNQLAQIKLAPKFDSPPFLERKPPQYVPMSGTGFSTNGALGRKGFTPGNLFGRAELEASSGDDLEGQRVLIGLGYRF